MKKELVAAVIAVTAAGSAGAANYDGFISNVTPVNGRVYIIVSGGHFDGTASTCYVNTSYMIYSFDGTTPVGKQLLAVALAAKAMKGEIYTFSDGSCLQGNPYSGAGSENIFGIDYKG